MNYEMDKKELAEAKRQGRRIRIRAIRRRVATGAIVLVATFSGLALYRSFDSASSISTTSATTTEDTGTSYLDQVATTVLSGDDDQDEGEHADEYSSASSGSSGSSEPAPLTSSQS